MSFGDGNVREKLEELQGRYDALVVVACFMADRMQSINYKEYGPASWDYIQRELGKLGIILILAAVVILNIRLRRAKQ